MEMKFFAKLSSLPVLIEKTKKINDLNYVWIFNYPSPFSVWIFECKSASEPKAFIYWARINAGIEKAQTNTHTKGTDVSTKDARSLI